MWRGRIDLSDRSGGGLFAGGWGGLLAGKKQRHQLGWSLFAECKSLLLQRRGHFLMGGLTLLVERRERVLLEGQRGMYHYSIGGSNGLVASHARSTSH